MSDELDEARPKNADLAWLAAAAWAAAALVAQSAGVRQISDDDYARTVISEAFVHAPKLDPSGTSWLPLPLVVNGLAMCVAGRSLVVVRVVALVLAACSGALLYTAARTTLVRPQAALLASLLPLTVPLVPMLAACPIPEAPTSALLAFAVIVSADARGNGALLAGAALLAATLSRYETWPVALLFAAWSLARARELGPRSYAAAALALLGPGAWMLGNLVEHGDALRFARRVAAYHDATASAREPLSVYAAAIFREAPIQAGGAIVAFSWCGPFLRRRLRFAAFGVFVLVASLTVAAVRGGAPTHHPERAIVSAIFVGSIVLVAAGQEALRRLTSQRLRAFVVMGGVLATLARGAGRVLPTWLELGADRSAEIEAGLRLRDALPQGDAVLVVPRSYGYFATVAAFGRPEAVRVISLRALDPRAVREDDPFASPDALTRAAADEGAAWILPDGDAQLSVARAVAREERSLGAGSLVRVR